MKKTITLTTEQAKELYEKDNSFRTTILSEFTDSELGIKKELKRWRELGFIDGAYIESDATITIAETNPTDTHGKNIFATKKQAESALAMAQLSQLMADLGDECDIDWGLHSGLKYVIYRWNNEIETVSVSSTHYFLSFKTKKVRDAFLEKHEELIKQYFMI